MRFYPSSYGTSRSAVVRRTREFNPCHDPKSGQFAPKGVGDCEAGEWDDPGRQRAIYGQLATDAEQHLALDEREVTRAAKFIDEDDDEHTAGQVKQEICAALGPELERHPGFEDFYRAHASQIASAPGNAGGGGSGDGEYDWHEDPHDLKKQYENEYESYREDAIQEIDDNHYSVLQDEYTADLKQARTAVAEKIGELRTLWDEAQQERDTGPYGDTEGHPTLPGLEDVERKPHELEMLPFLQEVLLKDAGIDPRALTTANGAQWEHRMENEVDFSDPGVREEIKARMRQYGKSLFDSDGEDNRTLAQLVLNEHSEYFGDENGRFNKYNDEGYGFDTWRDYSEGSEPDYDEIKSFQSWYEDEYGAPSTDSDDEDSGYNEGRGAKAMSWILHNWARTSGDGDPDSVMMQMAANDEFKLGATYTGVFQRRDAPLDAIKHNYKAHGAFARHALRAMYNHTQRELEAAGIEYVTLYRGFGIQGANERGLSSVNRNGDFVDVLMQPMSSFSSSYETAGRFTGYSNPTFMGVRVHRSQIIGTARTGYGCLNESEFVILGKRQPAFIVGKEALRNTYSPTVFWEAFRETQRRYYRPGTVVPGPGDRL